MSLSAPLSFSFDQSFNVRVVMRDGDPWFVAADVCAALGIVNNRDALEKLDDDERGVGLTDTTEGVRKVGIVNESGLYTLILRCRDATKPGTVPHRFRKWVTSEVIPSIRKTGSYVALGLADEKSYPYDLEFQVAEVAARMLRMSDTSKIRMLTGICEIKGVSSAFLPASVDETLVRSLTALLKEHRSSLSAKTANIALLDMGLLVEMERKGSKGDTKRFKSLSERGLQYGRNETSPQNPRETQPLYYVDRFATLLARIERQVAGGSLSLTSARLLVATSEIHG